MAKKDKATVKKADASAKKLTATSATKDRSVKEGKAKKWHSDRSIEDSLATELSALGLRIKDITGDGNCFFRALGDQLQGEEGAHVQLRHRIMSFIQDHEGDFAPFVEDDESFGAYVARMEKDGVWAGYMEVVAASRCLGANLTIYQAGQPRWRVINHPEDTAPMLHLSYHDGQHYNSVRCADDYGKGPPAPVVIRGDGTLAVNRTQRSGGDGRWDERDERRVVTSTACMNLDIVRRALEKAGGDVEAAIEAVIEALAEDETGASGKESPVASSPSSDAPCTTDALAASAADSAKTGDRNTGSTTCGTIARLPASSGLAAAAAEGFNPGLGPEAEVSVTESGPDGGKAARSASDPEPSDAAGAAVATMPRDPHYSSADPDQRPVALEQRIGGEGRRGPAGGDGNQEEEEEFCATSGKPTGASEGAAAAAAVAGPSEGHARHAAGAAASGRGGQTVRRRADGRKAGIVVGGAGAGPSNNKRCPCGSNRKYKACCGPAAAAAERRRAAAGAGDTSGGKGGNTEPAPGWTETIGVAQLAALVI